MHDPVEPQPKRLGRAVEGSLSQAAPADTPFSLGFALGTADGFGRKFSSAQTSVLLFQVPMATRRPSGVQAQPP